MTSQRTLGKEPTRGWDIDIGHECQGGRLGLEPVGSDLTEGRDKDTSDTELGGRELGLDEQENWGQGARGIKRELEWLGKKNGTGNGEEKTGTGM